MSLESLAKAYGMHDYLDITSGRIYQLSKATERDKDTLHVPVVENGIVIGYAVMQKVS